MKRGEKENTQRNNDSRREQEQKRSEAAGSCSDSIVQGSCGVRTGDESDAKSDAVQRFENEGGHARFPAERDPRLHRSDT